MNETKILTKDFFEDFLFYVALGEQDRAEFILKDFPEFMLSEYKSDIKSASEELTFHKTTAFKLAVRNCDWHMYNMMLKHIPEDKREKYEADLGEQLKELEANGLSYTLDNLSLYGLRVLGTGQQEPTEEQTQALLKENPYHLILYQDEYNKITNAELGFCGVNGQYARHTLPKSKLRDFILNVDNASLFKPSLTLSHKIVRNKKILNLAEKVINSLGGKTKILDNKTLKDHTDLLNSACKAHNDLSRNKALYHTLSKQWCVVIGRLQRLCFSAPNLAQYLMSKEADSWNIQVSDFKELKRPGLPSFKDKAPLFPFHFSFADSYAVRQDWRGFRSAIAQMWPPNASLSLDFLNNFHEAAKENLEELKNRLQSQASLRAAF